MAVFLFSLLFWEMMLRIVTEKSGVTAFPLLFLAALSLFFGALTGWFKKNYNHAAVIILLILLLIYYGAQLVYYRIFGSMFSVSMLGLGGAAITNFGWALRHSIIESIWWILLFCLPVIMYVMWLAIKKPPFCSCRFSAHAAVLTVAVLCWLLGVSALGLGGTGRYSAYDAYHNTHTDTDRASAKLGALPTTVIELSGSVFGAKTSSTAALISQTASMPKDFENAASALSPDGTAASAEGAGESEPYGESVDTSPNIIDAIDFEKLAMAADDEDIKNLCVYFSTVEGTNRNEYTGLFEGYNLIYICAEAFSPAAIHPVITPTLYELSTGGIILNNYYNSFINTTTNGEFAFMTGLWPDVSRIADEGSFSGSFSQSAQCFMPYGLGNIFNALGVKSYSFHNYLGSYYNRAGTHSNLGYECKFMDQGMTFSSLWPSSDLEMIEQSVDDFINQDRFNVYYMTFSGHGPYSNDNSITDKNYYSMLEQVKGYGYSYPAICYLANTMELEWAMQHLMQCLEEAGKADNTVIVLTGDHYPYYLPKFSYNELVGENVEPTFGYYESTCIMWCGALDEPIVNDSYCCNVDILPTILNLFGIEYDSRLLAGRDIFSSGAHVAMLYNKSYVTEYVKFDALSGEAYWQTDTAALDNSVAQEYLDYMAELVDTRYAASLMIIDTDFYRFVWENSGLMPEGYVPPVSSDD